MRKIAATILALMPLTAAATPAPLAQSASRENGPAKCDPFGRTEQAAVLRRSGPLARRLDQLPAGNLHLAVERQVNGCHQPVIVRENIGGAAFRPR
jgi:hypothetical protein